MSEGNLLQENMQKELNEEQSGLNLRPKTMFEMKGRARPNESGSDNYLPQWSKDGEGFKKQSDDRRKNKVIYRYSREELLALHVVSSNPPDVPEGTPVIAPDSLPPVANLPFDYEEIYKQWASNKDRARQTGRGRGQPRNDNSNSNTTNNNGNRLNGNTPGGRIGGGRQNTNDASNDGSTWEKGRRGSEDNADSSSRKWNDKRGDDSWERGARLEPSPKGAQDDLWDDVDPMGGDFKDMGLSNFAEAAELFRKEMDQMHLAAGRELRQQTSLESEDQFADSVEESDETPMWDMPTTTAEVVEKIEPLVDSEPQSLNLSSWSSFEQPQTPLRVSPPVDAWFYLDPQGLQQGPFKSAEMREWFEAGYFKPHLPIRFGHEGEFTSLANHFRHGQIPFSTIPSPNPQHQLLQQQKAAAAAAAHHQQLLLQKQQLEQQQQQQYLVNQLQQQRLMEQRRLQEDRMRLELQRIEMNHHAAHQQEQARLGMLQQQQFMYRQNAPTAPGTVGTGWPRPTLPRENIVSGTRENMMGGLGMYVNPPQPQPVEPSPINEFTWNKNEDPVVPSLWNSTTKNDPELSSWGGKPTIESKEETGWPTPESEWNKEQVTTTSTNESSWGIADQVVPKSSPTSWNGQGDTPTEHTQSSWGKADSAPQATGWGRQTSLESNASSQNEMNRGDPAPAVKSTAKDDSNSASKWDAPAADAPSLKQIQEEEQEEMRRRLKPQHNKQSKSIQQPPAQHIPSQEPQPVQPHLADMGHQIKQLIGVSNPSPPKSWGAATTPKPVARSLSLRDIQAEEERNALQKRQEKPIPSSRWSNVVTGTTPTPTVATTAAAPRPAPVEVKPTPPKDRDASFWNFEGSNSSQQRSGTPNNAFNAASNVQDDLLSWSAKQVKKLGGTEDLTLIQYCATLEDPGEIRECLAAYLGSTPKVSAFATEFIQRKKQTTGKKQTTNESKSTTQKKRK